MNNGKFITILTELITEASIEQLKTQFVDTNKISEEIFNEIIRSTGGSGAYTTWMVKRIVDKIIKPEDIYKYKKYLSIFNRRKKEFPYSDIFKYNTTNEISELIITALEIEKLEKTDLTKQKGVPKNEKYKELYIGNVDGFDVYKLPQGRKDLYGVSCELGSGSEWCTSTGNSRNYFDEYISEDDLYIFIRGDEKYQFHYGSDQFMDKNDQSII